jgi:hypothetical protein
MEAQLNLDFRFGILCHHILHTTGLFATAIFQPGRHRATR